MVSFTVLAAKSIFFIFAIKDDFCDRTSQEEPMNSYQALYYPFIHFKNDEWVKLSALYWDKLGRIVPNNYETKDSDTVKELGKFVENLGPGWVRPEFGEFFAEFLEQFSPQLQKKYAVALRDEHKWPEVSPELSQLGRDTRLAYVFYEKMSPQVRQVMNESGLALVEGESDYQSQWVGMHPRLAGVYMNALAEQLAGERGLRPLTDEAFDHLALSELSTERLAQALLNTEVNLVGGTCSPSEVNSCLLSIAFESVIPTNLSKVSVDQILTFREKYPHDRAKFQKAVGAFLENHKWLESITDKKVLEERIREEHQKTWVPQMEELKEKLGEVGVDTAWNSFNMKTALPAGIAMFLGALELTLDPVLSGAAGLTMSVIPMFRSHRKAEREAIKASNVSYLYQMERDLTTKNLSTHLQNEWKLFSREI